MAVIVDGKKVASIIKEAIKHEIACCDVTPGLAVVANKNDAASMVYVKNKQKDCEEVGIKCVVMPQDPEFTSIVIECLNKKDNINGIICQLPMVDGADEREVLKLIDPRKDVDGFVSDEFDPCTPAGIMELLKYYNVSVAGKHCVVVGRSNIVGRPMAKMLLDADGTVTVCHSKTKNLAEITKQADILVVAVGKRSLITADMVKNGAVVIDVGMNRDDDGKLCGDVDFDGVAQVASYITPVPGGIGPMTRAMLLVNTMKAFKNFQKDA